MDKVAQLDKELETAARRQADAEKKLAEKAEEIRLLQLEIVVRFSRTQKSSQSPRKPMRQQLETPVASAPASPTSSRSRFSVDSSRSQPLRMTPSKLKAK